MGTYLHPDAPETKDDVVALYSGGVDSYCMSYLTKPDTLLCVNMGGRYGDVEAANLHTPPELEHSVVLLECKAIGGFEDPTTSIIPGRNAFLALFGAQFGSTLLLASVYEEAHVGGADKDEGFAWALGQLFDHMFAPQRWLPDGRQVRLRLPVHQLTKTQLVGRTLLAGHSRHDFAERTFSCYEPVPDWPSGYKACGQCGACARRWAAFVVWGIEVEFGRPAAVDGYVAEARKLLETPSTNMNRQTWNWIHDWLDAENGMLRPVEQAMDYPMWERVR